MSERPSYCCGVCPPTARGGYDCTCRDNPRCPAPVPTNANADGGKTVDTNPETK